VRTRRTVAGHADSYDAGVDEPQWVQHAIWWHTYPLGLTGADTTGVDHSYGPRLDQVTSWLDHIVALGCNGLALGPVFASATHGYDTVDHFRIDPRLGDDAAFGRLVDAAHERGLRILLDGVFNHVGTGFGKPDWLRRKGGIVRSFEGHEGLLELDHDNPEVADHVVAVMNRWLDAGADAWRLDAAYATTPAFWAQVLPRVRANHPDVYVVGEMLHGDYATYVRRSGIDAVTQYELWKAIWSSINDQNFFELAHALDRNDALLDTFVPWTFLGNHDVTRIASQISDDRHHPHALVLLLTLAGTPAVYYGDEFGLRAVKEERVGGDDAIRPALDAPPALHDDSEVRRLHRELIGLRRRHPWLHRARTEVLSLANETIVLQQHGGGETLCVALNLSDTGLPVRGEVLAGTVRGGVVPAHDWAVVQVPTA
jgi:cyclomaltodextrinase